jgi:hypothetical protein
MYIESVDVSKMRGTAQLMKFFRQVPNIEKFRINEMYFVVYFTEEEATCNIGLFDEPLICTSPLIKTCAVYGKHFNFLKKGSFKNMAKFVRVIDDIDYIDVSNIESKPELFLQIYKSKSGITPQELADTVLRECKKGSKHAKFLIKEKPIILRACERYSISRKQLADKIGVKITSIETALSNGRVPKKIEEKIKEVFGNV